MSEKGSTSDVKNAMEGDSKRTRDQVGPESNAHVVYDNQGNMMDTYTGFVKRLPTFKNVLYHFMILK